MKKTVAVLALVAASTLAVAGIAAKFGGDAGGSGREGAGEVGDNASTTLVAAGDIASCSSSGDEKTAELVERIDPDAVLTLGDNAYESGTREEFRRCYDPSWGRFRNRTYPVPGNHDYRTPGAAGYFAYFGKRAGAMGKAYYSFDLGGWHLIALDTNVDVSADSDQLRWLRADLASDDHLCELAFFHHPRWSGSRHDSQQFVQPLWEVLAEEGVDVVLAGNDHNYQRFFKLDAQGGRDEDGVRSFVVGTGGASHYPTDDVEDRVRDEDDMFGVLALSLRRTSYDFEFVPAGGSESPDSMNDRGCV